MPPRKRQPTPRKAAPRKAAPPRPKQLLEVPPTPERLPEDYVYTTVVRDLGDPFKGRIHT